MSPRTEEPGSAGGRPGRRSTYCPLHLRPTGRITATTIADPSNGYLSLAAAGSTTLVPIPISLPSIRKSRTIARWPVRSGHPARPDRTDAAAGRWAGLPPRGTDRPTHRSPRLPTGSCDPHLPRGSGSSPAPQPPHPCTRLPPLDPPIPHRVLSGSSPGTGPYPAPATYPVTAAAGYAEFGVTRPRSGNRSPAGRRPFRPVGYRPYGRSPGRRRRTDLPTRHRRSRCGTGSSGVCHGDRVPQHRRRARRHRRRTGHNGPAGRSGTRPTFGRHGGLGTRPHSGGDAARSRRDSRLADHCGVPLRGVLVTGCSGLDTNNAAPRLAGA